MSKNFRLLFGLLERHPVASEHDRHGPGSHFKRWIWNGASYALSRSVAKGEIFLTPHAEKDSALRSLIEIYSPSEKNKADQWADFLYPNKTSQYINFRAGLKFFSSPLKLAPSIFRLLCHREQGQFGPVFRKSWTCSITVSETSGL